MEDVLNIPGSIHSISQEGNAVYADEVFDKRKNKKQQLVNQETDEALEAQNQHIGTLEEAVGAGGSVDERIAQAKSEAESDIKGGASEDYDTLKKAEDAIKAEVNAREGAVSDEASARQDAINTAKTEIIGGASTDCNTLGKAEIKISTNAQDIAQLQAAYEALTESDVVVVAPTDTWPVAAPQQNTIYRVADRVNTPPQNYSDYMYNGTAMVLMATYNNAIDPRPKKGSQNLVSSGGVFDNMGALDVSELNATENPHTLATYADLSAALATIPSDYQKGGMSIKFVQSSDNKYVSYMLNAQNWTVNITYWEKINLEYEVGQKVNDNPIGNLINPELIVVGYGINSSGNIAPNADLKLTGFIKVNEQNIISNGFGNPYWGIGVYDENRNFIRFINSEGYIYQDGDAYVRFSILKTTTNPMANYGNVLAVYTEYNPIEGYLSNYTKNTEFNKLAKRVYVPYIPNATIAAQHAIVELYLIGLDASKNYYIKELRSNNTGKIRVYIAEVDSTNVLAYSEYTKDDGDIIPLLESGNSGINGYVITDIGGESINLSPTLSQGIIDKSFVSDLTYNTRIAIEKFGIGLSVINSEINSLHENKVDKFLGDNLIDTSAFIVGKGISQTGAVSTNIDLSISDYIPVDGKNIISNGYVSPYWPMAVYDSSRTLLRVINNSLQYIYQSGDSFIRVNFLNTEEHPMANYGTVLLPYENYSPIAGYLAEYWKSEQLSFDVANGKLDSFGSYQSELECSPIVNNAADVYIGFKESGKGTILNNRNDLVVAINHDDFPNSDLIGNRKIYNKYGMNANFNFILTPFVSLNSMKSRIENVKKIVKDGNQIGLHSILGKSYWWMNKAFDIRPDGTFTFAPSVSDLQGQNQDHTGTNAFGKQITASTTASDAGYIDIPTSVENPKVIEITVAQLAAINRCYSVYGDYAYTITGLNLDDIAVSKTTLQWLEYWYNELIDNTLGYSSTNSDVSTKFAEDYDDATKYPDAEHLANGKMVHYQDTSNPNYSDSSYQKVGKFTKGLFKGCFSCCNWEVIDRCIDVAKAFCRHYYGFEGFTSFGRHGVGFFERYWTDNNGYHYDNSSNTILLGEGGLFYASRIGKFTCEYDILVSEGIRMVNHIHPLRTEYFGQVGLYHGQSDIQGGEFNVCDRIGGITNYLNFFGNKFSETMDYASFEAFISGVDDWLKFAYENAGQTLTRGSKTYTVFPLLKNMMDYVRQCIGTGKIPAFSLDTIAINPSISTAVDLFLRYCYRLGIQVVPMEVARQIANNQDFRKDYFPNPMFKQSILEMFGGSCTSPHAYIPNGWGFDSVPSDTVFTVGDEVIDGLSRRRMNIETEGNLALNTMIFGLSGGNYKLRFYAKKESISGSIVIKLLRNSSLYETTGETIYTVVPETDWEIVEKTITIPQPKKKEVTLSSPISQICRGYEDNVCGIRIGLVLNNGSISIASPSLIPIE